MLGHAMSKKFPSRLFNLKDDRKNAIKFKTAQKINGREVNEILKRSVNVDRGAAYYQLLNEKWITWHHTNLINRTIYHRLSTLPLKYRPTLLPELMCKTWT